MARGLHLFHERHRRRNAGLSARTRDAPGAHIHLDGKWFFAANSSPMCADDRRNAPACRDIVVHTQADEQKDSKMTIVELDSVSKAYAGQEALRDISLQIEQGQRVVILGPSGCGKTSILRLIAGFITPDSGSVSIGDKLVSKDGRILVPPQERRLGMVFQDLALWPHLTAKGNLEFGLKAKGIKKSEREQRIKKILDMVGMKDFSRRKPAELSGGQQQRVALGRALVSEPEVLLMDEPLSSLDLELNQKLRKELLRLQEKLKITLLYVTHDREEAAEIATRVVTIKEGRIISDKG